MQKKGHTHFCPYFGSCSSVTLNGQNNFSRALKWGISCFSSYNSYGDIGSIKNAIFSIDIVNLIVFTKLRKFENGYFHVFCYISKSIQDTETYNTSF